MRQQCCPPLHCSHAPPLLPQSESVVPVMQSVPLQQAPVLHDEVHLLPQSFCKPSASFAMAQASLLPHSVFETQPHLCVVVLHV